jgi:hypothetical protein
LTIAAALAAASLAAGCSTFSDTDVVASVGEDQLTEDELDDLLLEVGATEDDLTGTLPLDVVRQSISLWVQEAAIGIDDDDIAATYALGIEESGVACPRLLVAETPDDAESVVERLLGGEAYDTVFGDANIDPSLADSVGRVDCLPLSQFPEESRDSTDVAALFAVNQNMPYAAATIAGPSGDAGIVVGFRPYDDLDPAEAAAVATAIRSEAALGIDIEMVEVAVNPRYGTFDAATGTVVAL